MPEATTFDPPQETAFGLVARRVAFVADAEGDEVGLDSPDAYGAVNTYYGPDGDVVGEEFALGPAHPSHPNNQGA